MFASLLSWISESISDISQNPIAFTIFVIISLLVILLILATVSPFWRAVLIRIKFLEKNERPISFLLWIVSIVVVVEIVQTFFLQPFIVDGGSMLPTFHNKEFLLVDKLSYRISDAKRGDIAIFKLYELGANNTYIGKYLIKRVIGLPGERVVVKDGKTTIYNSAHPQGFTLDEKYIAYKDLHKDVDITLDKDHYFMMGDNRAQSYDSRDWGPLQKENMRGRVLFRVYPLDVFGYLPGEYSYDH